MHNTDVALFEVVNLGVAKLSQVDITSKDGTTRQTKAYYLPPEQIEYLSPADIIAIYPLNSTDHQSPIKPDLDDAGALAFIHPDAKTYIQTVNGGVSVRTCIMSLLNEDGEHPPSVATPKSFGILAMFKRGKKPITLRWT